jgi:hypothetical protein
MPRIYSGNRFPNGIAVSPAFARARGIITPQILGVYVEMHLALYAIRDSSVVVRTRRWALSEITHGRISTLHLSAHQCHC